MKKNFGFLLLLIWLALLPWHAFLKTWLSALFLGSNADFLPAISNILSLWKEVALFMLLAIFIFSGTAKNFWRQFTKGHWLWLGAFIITMLVCAGLQAPSLTALVLGIRTDLLFVPALFLGVLVAQNLDQKSLATVVRVSVISLSVAVSLGVLAWFIAPNLGLNFGYSPYQSSFVENKPLPVYHCLFIDEQCIPRLQATFSGPNQTGSLMILLIGLILFTIHNSQSSRRDPFGAILNLLYLLLPVLGLILTFSRSALIGAIISSFMLIPRKVFLIALSVVIIIAAGIFVLKSDVITHGLSSSEHWEKTITGVTYVLENPLGTGFGSTGPVSRRLFGQPTEALAQVGEDKALISENWYLQIAEEGGIIPALLFIIWLTICIYTLFKSKHLGKFMAFVLLATSIQAFFLHLWEDSVITMLIWFFVGLAMHQKPQTEPN